MNVRSDSVRSPLGVTPGVHLVPTRPVKKDYALSSTEYILSCTDCRKACG